ncbi:MAG: transposase [Planctomycetota bacterium]|nr:transposase [Planctomycetota bacterium]
MVIAYHAIFTTYGTWLPNDPRGSFSKAIYNAELAALGGIQYGRQNPQPDALTLRRFRTATVPTLSRAPYFLNDKTRALTAAALEREVGRLQLAVYACAIMNDHVHLVILRSKYRIEYIINQVKGRATSALGLSETPWTRGGWKVFLDDEEAVHAALAYVEANPPAAGLAPQQWSFVQPLPPRGV